MLNQTLLCCTLYIFVAKPKPLIFPKKNPFSFQPMNDLLGFLGASGLSNGPDLKVGGGSNGGSYGNNGQQQQQQQQQMPQTPQTPSSIPDIILTGKYSTDATAVP